MREYPSGGTGGGPGWGKPEDPVRILRKLKMSESYFRAKTISEIKVIAALFLSIYSPL